MLIVSVYEFFNNADKIFHVFFPQSEICALRLFLSFRVPETQKYILYKE